MSAELAMQRWPSLRDAAPPAPFPRQSGRSEFRVADEWAQFVQRVVRGEYQLRAPAASTAGLCGPFHSIGSCLEPVKQHGDLTWIDPTMPAEDGDLVVVQWHPEKLRRIIERNRHKPEWLAMYGDHPADIAGKWLRKIGNEYWTVTRSSMMPLGESPLWGGADRVLGVVRYIERNGRPLYGCGPVPVHNITLNAATTVYQSDEDGPLDFTCADGDNTEMDWVSTPIAVTIDEATDAVEVVASFSLELTAVGTLGSTYTGAYGGTSSSAPSYGANTPNKTTAAVEMVSSVMTIPSGTLTAGTHYFGVGSKITHTIGGGATTVRIRNVEVQVTVVKR